MSTPVPQSVRRWWRRAALGIPTVLGLARRGWFIPYRYAGAIEEDRRPIQAIEALFRGCEPAFLETLAKISAVADMLSGFDGPPPRPRWSQDWFPGLDGAAAYALMWHDPPGRLIEIGSGHSTRFLLAGLEDARGKNARGKDASGKDASGKDAFLAGAEPRVTCVDPAPRADLEGLPVTLLRRPLQAALPDLDLDLAAGDVLFVDSSHVAMPGSDVDLVVNRILPALPAGVLVHIHDVFLPDPYPESWSWRGYNEQNVIAPLLLAGRLVPVFSSHWARSRMVDALGAAATLPLRPGAIESSLWTVTR